MNQYPPTSLAARPGDGWRRALAASAVPQHIIGDGPERDWKLDPERFRWRPEEDAAQPVRPSRRKALEALPERGSVLDVGVGAGASSLGLVAKAGLIVGVDPSEGMLELFTASALASGVDARAVLGRWPEAVTEVEAADVAVCHHAMYGITDIEDFVEALTARARRRVVIELSASPPQSGLNPLWKAIHGIELADRRVADEAETVLAAMGLDVGREDIVLPAQARVVTPEMVAFVRGRLYVGPERDPEIAEVLEAQEPREHRVAALWWPGGA